jgi:hypothetical protein
MHCREIALFNAISFRRYPFLLSCITMKFAPDVLIMFLVIESAYPKIVGSPFLA